MHVQYPPRLHPNSYRLRIDVVHRPAPTRRLYLDVASQHHTRHRPQYAVPLSITQRALRSSHYASAYSAYRTLAPRLAIAYSSLARRGGSAVFPTNSSLTPTASPSRLPHATVRSPHCNVAFASHTRSIASDGFLPQGSQLSPCVRGSTGTDCGERLRRVPCPVPHCLSPYFSFRVRICYINVHSNFNRSQRWITLYDWILDLHGFVLSLTGGRIVVLKSSALAFSPFKSKQ
ncbi:hypothetical protein B0H13DRAFT_2343321 [Mycena leptocephala]|nr:hypothetical protein B0H13DRAFT_2343321 [Mycena leptocephala]